MTSGQPNRSEPQSRQTPRIGRLGTGRLVRAWSLALTGLLLVAASTPDSIRTALERMGYTLEVEERTSGPINGILFDRAHATMWGASSNHGEDYGIAW